MDTRWIKAGMTGAVAGVAMVVSAGVAQAMPTLDFQVDYGGSSVTLTEVGSLGNGASITASIAGAGLGTPFSLGVGLTETFDFIDFSVICNDFFCSAGKDYNISATLAFAVPNSSVSSDGDAGAAIIFGSIVGGGLFWDDVPATLTTNDGSMYTVDFEDGIALFENGAITTTASVTVDKIVEVAEPAALALFGLGLLGLGLAARRRRGTA